MARYIGPKTKIARKFREPIYGPDSSFEKKKYPPGQHGNSKRRKKQSEYGMQLMEKQKAKYTYGILERQFRKLYKKASSKKGITGEVLLQLAEQRLDNMVFALALRQHVLRHANWLPINTLRSMAPLPIFLPMK